MEATPQTIGLVMGVVVFCCTLLAILLLLIYGGSFERMRQQAETYNGVGPSALKQSLKPRPELYDELLEAAKKLPRVPAAPPSHATGGGDIVAGEGELRGHQVTLRVLRAAEDAERLFEACNGSPAFDQAYDPELALWNLSPHGPFETVQDLKSSPLVQPLADGLRFTVFDRETGRVIGMAAILGNEPSCLRTEIGDIWLNPAFRETRALQDIHYLLLSHLFGLGYRRVERRVDAGDTDARIDLPAAGFHLEGVLKKHMIVKGCNRDTAMFSMVNSGWRDRAKAALEKMLAPDGGVNSKKAKARARARQTAVEAAEKGSKDKDA
ncbi:unnamed protein product [Ectocarpus sp. 6 AP-2014]